MDHDQHVFTHGMYLLFCFFMPCPEPPMGISGVGSFPVQSGGSLIFFQLFRCRNLALNRVFSYFLVAGMFLYLGVSGHPHICTPPYVHIPCMFIHPLGVYTPPICPHTPVHLCIFGGFACCGGVVMGSPLCWDTSLTPSLFGGASPSITPPHSVIGSLCIGMFQ